eukprot:568271-Amphidinium_carterae.1
MCLANTELGMIGASAGTSVKVLWAMRACGFGTGSDTRGSGSTRSFRPRVLCNRGPIWLALRMGVWYSIVERYLAEVAADPQ